MKFTQAEIRQAAQQAAISDAQQAAMFSILQENKQAASGGLGSTLLLWFGGLLILSALRWPLQRVFENETDWTQAALSGVVVLFLLVLGLRVHFAQKGAAIVGQGSSVSSGKGSANNGALTSTQDAANNLTISPTQDAANNLTISPTQDGASNLIIPPVQNGTNNGAMLSPQKFPMNSAISSPKDTLNSWSGAIILFFALSSISVLVATLQICLGWKADKEIFFLLSDDVFLPALVTFFSASLLLYCIPHRLFAFSAYASCWLASMSLLYCLDSNNLFLSLNDEQSAQAVGIALFLITFFIDHRYKQDYAAIGYIFGALSLWGGLAITYPSSELDRFLFFIFNLFFISIGFVLARYVFIVLGSLGACIYLEHIADKYMDEIYYQMTVCSLGLVILLLGLYVHKHRRAIMDYSQRILPRWLVAMRPVHRR